MTPEVNAQIAAIRQRAAEGTATAEDFKLAVKLMREGRMSAHAASEGSRRKVAKAAIPSAEDMLSELEGL